MKEFKINEFLTLKLEEGETDIYMNGEFFNQCKYLMLNISIEDTEKFEEIESIDEAADILGWTFEGQKRVNYDIDPETEFWGHCSNLQAWYEHGYDTRLLHSNLAFSLLKALVDAGDPIARKMFKEEIAKRFESGYPSVMSYLYNERYLDYLDKEERFFCLLNMLDTFPDMLDTFPDSLQVFFDLIDAIRGTELMKERFPDVLKMFDKYISDEYSAFSSLLSAIRGTKILEENLHGLLNILDNFSGILYDDIFTELVYAMEGTKFLTENFSDLLNVVEQYKGFPFLVEAIIGMGLIEEKFPEIINRLDKLYDDDFFNWIFQLIDFRLFDAIRSTELMEETFVILLNRIGRLSGYNKFQAFSKLIKVVKEKELSDKRYYSTETKLIDTHYSLIESKLSELLKEFDKLPDYELYKYNALSELINAIKGTELMNGKFSLIETKFSILLKRLDKLHNREQFDAFSKLIGATKGTKLGYNNLDLIKTKLNVLLIGFDKLSKQYPSFIFRELIEAINRTEIKFLLYPTIEDKFPELLGGSFIKKRRHKILKKLKKKI